MRRPNSFENARHGDRIQGDRPSHFRRPFSPRDRVSPDVVQELLSRAYVIEQASREYAESELARQSEQFSAAIAAREKLATINVTFEDALDFIVARAASITSAHGAAIAVSQGEIVVCRARCGMAPSLGAQVNPATGFSGRCLGTGEVLCCEDTQSDPRVASEYCAATQIRSVLAVPIRRGQQVFGIIEIYSPFVAAFRTTEVRTLQLLAGSVADAAGGRDLHQELAIPIELEQSLSEPMATEVAAQTGTADPSADAADPQVQYEAPVAGILEDKQPSRSLKWFVRALAVGILALSSWLAVRMIPPKPTKIAALPSTPASAPLVLPAPPPLTSESIQVGPVQFHSRPELTTITIELSAPVTFSAERLDHPERIYFDLANAVLDPQTQKLVDVNDSRLRRIRIGMNDKGGARVVLDLNCSCEYTAIVTTVPPFKLVVAVHPSFAAGTANRAPDSSGIRSTSTTKKAAVTLSPRWPDLRIVIDPGHGGSDLGAVGRSGLQEKELVLDVAQRLGALITGRMGAQVIYTRTADVFVPLQSRPAMAKESHADLFISIHGNSSDSRNVRGVETFYSEATFTPESSTVSGGELETTQNQLRIMSRTFASALQAALYKSLAASDRGLRDRGIKPRALTVLERPSLPAVLTEIAFLTSPAQERKLQDPKYRDRIAEALYRGLATFVLTSAPRLPRPGVIATSRTIVPVASMR